MKLNFSFSLARSRKMNVETLKKNYGNAKIKQYSNLTYLGCELDKKLWF